MSRQEFGKPVKVEILTRSRNELGVPRCEHVDEDGRRCGATKGLDVHHNTKMDAMKSDEDKAKIKLTAADGLALCKSHHAEETAIQQADLAKAKRVEAKALGIQAAGGKRGFARVSKERPPMRVASGVSELARRYRDV